MRMPKLAASAFAAVLAAALLSGCTATALQKQYTDGDNKGYIDGSGVTEVKLADRSAPVVFSGKTEGDSDFSSAAHKGQVVVVNFWYAECPPCRLEAKELQKINAQYAAKGVVFIGVNTRDDGPTAQSFDDKFGVDYPSILDADSGKAQLAFSGKYRPAATPTTIVLDKQGRIAARMLGAINNQPSTLESLIDSALAENSTS
jgi:thiol-disulfide isomerase/thioredoxin